MRQKQSTDPGAEDDDSNSHDEEEYSDGEEDEEAQGTTGLGAAVEKISRHKTVTWLEFLFTYAAIVLFSRDMRG